MLAGGEGVHGDPLYVFEHWLEIDGRRQYVGPVTYGRYWMEDLPDVVRWSIGFEPEVAQAAFYGVLFDFPPEHPRIVKKDTFAEERRAAASHSLSRWMANLFAANSANGMLWNHGGTITPDLQELIDNDFLQIR
jgi:hypothetical protein